MLGWSFIPASFSDEKTNKESTQEMLVLFFSVHPGMIFDKENLEDSISKEDFRFSTE